MSYARFGAGGSDVYVYLDVRGCLCCCGCGIGDQWHYDTTDEMIAHLRQHQAAGDVVLESTIQRLESDREENDEWIVNEQASNRHTPGVEPTQAEEKKNGDD